MTTVRLNLIGVAAALLIGGCERQGETTTAPPPRPRIALVMKSLSNEFFGTMAEGAMAYHAQHDDAYDLTVDGIKNETDLAGQIALVERMMAKHVDAIVIAPADSKALVPVLRRAIGEGVAVVNIDNRLDPQTLQMAQIKIPYVGPDNRAGAAAVGRVVAARLSKGDEVAIIEESRPRTMAGNADWASRMRSGWPVSTSWRCEAAIGKWNRPEPRRAPCSPRTPA